MDHDANQNQTTHNCDLCDNYLTINPGSHGAGALSTPSGYGWVRITDKGEATTSKRICLQCVQDITEADKTPEKRTGEWYYWNVGDYYIIRIMNPHPEDPATIGEVNKEEHAEMIVKAMNDIVFPVEKTPYDSFGMAAMQVTNCKVYDCIPTEREPGEWYSQELENPNDLIPLPQAYPYSLRTKRETQTGQPGITYKPDYLLEGYVNDEDLANSIVEFMNEDRKGPDAGYLRPHGTFYHVTAPIAFDNYDILMTDVTTQAGFLKVGTIHGKKIVDQIVEDLNDNHPNPKITEHEGLWYTDYRDEERGYALIQRNQGVRTPVNEEYGIIHGKEHAEKIAYYLNRKEYKATIFS